MRNEENQAGFLLTMTHGFLGRQQVKGQQFYVLVSVKY